MTRYGWFRRRGCHALQYNDEQDIVNSLRLDENGAATGTSRTSVLYGVHLQGSRTVVVNKFQNEKGTVDAHLDGRCRSEVNMLTGIRHGNIITLLGSIRRDNFILLVYDHMENGSLQQWLHPTGLSQSQLAEGERRLQLDWPARRAVAIGVAGGLCYMHHGRNNPIVHHNINSTNILLDRDLKAKIAGFGLARVNLAGLDQPVPISELTDANMFGYSAPEYVTGEVTQKVDVYSFGVVLLELVTGRVANQTDVTDGHLAIWAQQHFKELMKNNGGGFRNVVAMDIRADQGWYLKEMADMFRLGVDCTVKDPRERPAMSKVVHRLRNSGRFGRTCYQP